MRRNEILRLTVAGVRPLEMPAQMLARGYTLTAVECRVLLQAALADLRAENSWLASSELDIRLARFDRLTSMISPDLDHEAREVRYAASKEIREVERDRQRLLIGIKQCAAIERELDSDEAAPRTSINFVRDGQARAGHEASRSADDVDDEASTW